MRASVDAKSDPAASAKSAKSLFSTMLAATPARCYGTQNLPVRVPISEVAVPVQSTLRIRVNGAEHDVAADPATPLLYVLRNELELNGPKFGCGLGQCGACTVHVDGAPRRSCVTEVSAVAGKEVVTLEGLGTPERPHPLQQAFIDEQAAQCGYCINGMIMRAAALLARTPRPSRDEITTAMSSNLCRCGTHMRIVRAIARAAEDTSSAPSGRED